MIHKKQFVLRAIYSLDDFYFIGLFKAVEDIALATIRGQNHRELQRKIEIAAEMLRLYGRNKKFTPE